MKKIWIPIVLFCYLAVSSGIVVNFHYCMNRLASTELFATEGKRCEKCGMNMHKGRGCCRDEVKIIKMKGDQKITASISFELPSVETNIAVPSPFINTSFYNALTPREHLNHSPPLLTEQDTYLQNCVFRI